MSRLGSLAVIDLYGASLSFCLLAYGSSVGFLIQSEISTGRRRLGDSTSEIMTTKARGAFLRGR